MTLPWASLNNHKVTLSFKPASDADEQALLALLPEGEITDPSQLPTSIPSYLINVIPEIAVDGQVVKQGFAMRLGEDLTLVFQPTRLGQSLETQTYTVPAGAYLSLAATAGSVSPQVLQDLKTKLEQTKTTLESGNPDLIGTLTREDVLGDLFYAGVLGYFGQHTALGHISSLAQAARYNLGAGYGSLGYEPEVFYFFRLPPGH